jgi:hypothetical protein
MGSLLVIGAAVGLGCFVAGYLLGAVFGVGPFWQ